MISTNGTLPMSFLMPRLCSIRAMDKVTIYNIETQRETFERWKEENPQGFFLNCRRGSKGRRATKQDKIHRLGHSHCSALSSHRAWPSEGWWKVVAMDTPTLLSWFTNSGAK